MTPAGRIHPATSIGAVHLTVGDLGRSCDFYTGRLGLRAHGREAATARLGAGGPDLLVLRERRDAPRPRGTTGLYHFALRVPSRLDLARALAHLHEQGTRLTGAADHEVSEALYLSDPDGIGIEIYRDRPRSEWRVDGTSVRLTTDPLDFAALLEERRNDAAEWTGLPPGTTMGHVHLHVSELDEAERFYVGVLGFDRTARLGDSASFVSAGGYHHHVGLNTWMGVGAPPPPEGAIGLRHVVVSSPDRAERDRIVARARTAGVEVREVDGDYEITDPSSNHLRFAASA